MEPMIRHSFPEDSGMIEYDPVDWKPTFQELYSRQSEVISITLKNRMTGGLEKMDFRIVGATESPITTFKWIWGKICTDDGLDYDLGFDYYDGLLRKIVVSASPKSVPVEKTAERSRKIRYAAEITTFDIFSKIDDDE